jgi:AAA15 family ATPase/GTPase
VGENNAGKSNITRAPDLLLGEYWPGSHEPNDHEYHGRHSDGNPIKIDIWLRDVNYFDRRQGAERSVTKLSWFYPPTPDGSSLMMSWIPVKKPNG